MNSVLNGFLVVFNPKGGWAKIADQKPSMVQTLALHTIPFALIPAVCWLLLGVPPILSGLARGRRQH